MADRPSNPDDPQPTATAKAKATKTTAKATKADRRQGDRSA